MRPERKITRLREYNYAQNGAYAVTICVRKRLCAFGRIKDGVMALNPYGRFALECWLAIPDHFPQVVLDEFIVMPNHIHGILFIDGEAAPTPEEEIQLRRFGKPQSASLGTIVGSFKSAVTKEIGRLRGMKTWVWQERFYDHVIRHDRDLQLQREYVQNNPAQWASDEFNTV